MNRHHFYLRILDAIKKSDNKRAKDLIQTLSNESKQDCKRFMLKLNAPETLIAINSIILS